MNFKLNILAIAFCLVTFISCSSDDAPIDNGGKGKGDDKLIEVNFSVKDFYQAPADAKSTAVRSKSTLQAAGIKVLQYRIVDLTEGKEVAKKILRIVNQAVPASGEVLIKEKLTVGQYAVMFVGSTNADLAIPDVKMTDERYDIKSSIVYLPDYKTEIFTGSLALDVTNESLQINKEVVLDRSVGQVNITIEDAQKMPTNVNFLYPVVKSFYPNAIAFQGLWNAAPFGTGAAGTLYGPLAGQNITNGKTYITAKPTGFKSGNVARADVVKNATYTLSLFMFDNQKQASDINAMYRYNGQDYGNGLYAYTKIYIYGTTQEVTTSPMGDSTFPYVFEYEVKPATATVSTGINVVKGRPTNIACKLFGGFSDGTNTGIKVTVNDTWGTPVTTPYIIK